NYFLYAVVYFVSFFFFQAEDGIRDFHVTGVQTCALPIWATICRTSRSWSWSASTKACSPPTSAAARSSRNCWCRWPAAPVAPTEIGRASCRERVENWGGAGGG